MKRLFLTLIGILFLTGCGLFADNDNDPCSDGFVEKDGICVEELRREGSFTSEQDILDLFVEFRDRQNTLGFFSGRFVTFAESAMDDSNTDAPTSDEQGSDDYSETNNQVEGVDEMDNVLTDGKHLYIATYDRIQIVLAYTLSQGPSALRLVKEITFDELRGDYEWINFQGLYVDEDRLMVVATAHDYTCIPSSEVNPDETGDDTGDVQEEGCYYYDYSATTVVYEYSTDDFELENTYELSGYFVGSRKIGDALYMVTNTYVPFYYLEREDITVSLDRYLPYYSTNGTSVSLGYEDIYYVEGTQPTNFTTFYGIDLGTTEVSTEVVLGEGGYNLYVSTENIYLTNTKWNFNDAVWAEVEDAREDGDDDFVPDENPYEIMTSIIRIGIDAGRVTFAANGEVPGTVLDQFSMDERDGHVRIVTTEQNWWWWGFTTEDDDQVDNRLIILDMDLNQVAMLDDIGKPNESVQAVRFVGDYAYVVTFLRTDPFYVIDVSDPTNPTKLSELEIPGFSDYLQPLGEDYILGIGYGDHEGGTQGLKISLYDVSDKTNAVVASELIYPYADNSYMWTSTVYNHKDLLVSLAKGIVSLPYTLHSWGDGDDWWWKYQTGILVLNIDLEAGEISERGRVEHSATDSYDTYMYKSKFIDDYLYTISSKYVMVSTLADPDTILHELLIGSPLDLEVPGGVEPVDPEAD
jgi:uncharacterized secreted protein with C-terminal beta-propeller domain